jgi:hypothetical protein
MRSSRNANLSAILAPVGTHPRRFQNSEIAWGIRWTDILSLEATFREEDLSDGMRRPVSSGMRYAPNDPTRSRRKIKETGYEGD